MLGTTFVPMCSLSLLEKNVKHQSTFLLFYSKVSSNIYRADLFRMEGRDVFKIHLVL